jgi:hypothetical protein
MKKLQYQKSNIGNEEFGCRKGTEAQRDLSNTQGPSHSSYSGMFVTVQVTRRTDYSPIRIVPFLEATPIRREM